MTTHILAILSGAVFVMAVIAGVGPQSLNIMSHAIRRNYAYSVGFTCFIADSVLILLGGVGLSLSGSTDIILMINVIGILFMTWYTINKIISLFKQRKKFQINDDNALSQKQAVVKALALTLLNPLVFIDTIVVIGGTASQYHGATWVDFMIGAVLGDFAWIFGLAYLAKSFSNQLNKAIIWIMLDVMTIIIILIILYKTIGYVIH